MQWRPRLPQSSECSTELHATQQAVHQWALGWCAHNQWSESLWSLRWHSACWRQTSPWWRLPTHQCQWHTASCPLRGGEVGTAASEPLTLVTRSCCPSSETGRGGWAGAEVSQRGRAVWGGRPGSGGGRRRGRWRGSCSPPTRRAGAAATRTPAPAWEATRGRPLTDHLGTGSEP